MNPWIVFKNTDFCNLKLIATLSVYVLLHVSQRILKCACHLLLPLAETTAKKYFYSKAVSRFKKTGQFCRKCLTTRSKKAKGKMYRSAVQSSTINVTINACNFTRNITSTACNNMRVITRIFLYLCVWYMDVHCV